MGLQENGTSFSVGLYFKKKKKPLFFVTRTLQDSEILFLHIHQLVRKLGSEHRLSHNMVPPEQRRLRELLNLVVLALEPLLF